MLIPGTLCLSWHLELCNTYLFIQSCTPGIEFRKDSCHSAARRTSLMFKAPAIAQIDGLPSLRCPCKPCESMKQNSEELIPWRELENGTKLPGCDTSSNVALI